MAGTHEPQRRAITLNPLTGLDLLATAGALALLASVPLAPSLSPLHWPLLLLEYWTLLLLLLEAGRAYATVVDAFDIWRYKVAHRPGVPPFWRRLTLLRFKPSRYLRPAWLAPSGLTLAALLATLWLSLVLAGWLGPLAAECIMIPLVSLSAYLVFVIDPTFSTHSRYGYMPFFGCAMGIMVVLGVTGSARAYPAQPLPSFAAALLAIDAQLSALVALILGLGVLMMYGLGLLLSLLLHHRKPDWWPN